MQTGMKATTQEEYKDLVKFYSHASVKALQYIQKSYISTNKLRDSLQNKKVFTIADYGCSTGTMSIDILKYLITQIRKCQKSSSSSPAQERVIIRLLMNDLPQNDFKLLQLNLKNGLGELFTKQIEIIEKPFSFYQKVAEDQEVDFGFSIYTSQWLRKQPSTYLKNSVWAIEQNSEEVFKEWVDQAHQDMKLFFSRRILEMNKGSYLLVINLGNEYEGMKAGSSYQTQPGTGCIKQKLRSQGFESKYVDCIVIGVHYRSDAQIKKALNEVILKEQEQKKIGCQYKVTGFCIPEGMHFKFAQQDKNFLQFAKHRTQFVKSTSYALYRSQILALKADSQYVQKLLKRFWELQLEYYAEIEKHPENPQKYYLQAIELFK